jgi:hypothetical protein
MTPLPLLFFIAFANKKFFRNDAIFRIFMESTDKRTDAWWDIFMILKIDFGLLAVGWAGLWNKRFGLIMSNF